jgi:hypothetical protein
MLHQNQNVKVNSYTMEYNTMLEELKPCPNCKSTNLKDHYIYICCLDCHMRGPASNGGMHDEHSDWVDHVRAHEYWNKLPRRPIRKRK